MWLLLLQILLSVDVSAATTPIDTSIGPVSSTEAKILWDNAQSAYAQGKFSNAIYPFKRLLDRYPGYPDATQYREMKFELAHSYLESPEPGGAESAIPYLKAYLDGSGGHRNLTAAKIALCQAYLKVGLFHEANLLTSEIERSELKENQATALLLRARAQIGLDQDKRAELSVASARRLSEKLKVPHLIADSLRMQLELKTRECARHPAPGPMPESQVLAQLDFRGICLNEALSELNQVLGYSSAPPADQATALMRQGFLDFKNLCKNPPEPPPLEPIPGEVTLRKNRDRTQTELARYRAELSEKLKSACDEHLNTAQAIVSGWEKSAEGRNGFVASRLHSLKDSLQ